MKRDKDCLGFFTSAGFPLVFLMVLALVFLSGCNSDKLSFSSEYQAVFLDNGQVFFGKLSNTNSSFFTLRDVYYVEVVKEKDKKELKNILVKRGNEWHNPKYMRINSRHVVVIEPVGAHSRVAQLIREAEKAPPGRPVSAPPAMAPSTTPTKPSKPKR